MTEPTARSRKPRANVKADTEKSKKKKSVQSKERGTRGDTTRKRKALQPRQLQNKSRKPVTLPAPV